MTKVFRKWLTATGFALLALAATIGFTSCASSTPVHIYFNPSSGALPAVSVGHAYSTGIYGSGVTGPPTGVYQFTLESGSLPSGLKLSTVNTTGTNTTSAAVISGTDNNAADAGKTFTFTVQATDILKPPTVAESGSYTITVK